MLFVFPGNVDGEGDNVCNQLKGLSRSSFICCSLMVLTYCEF